MIKFYIQFPLNNTATSWSNWRKISSDKLPSDKNFFRAIECSQFETCIQPELKFFWLYRDNDTNPNKIYKINYKPNIESAEYATEIQFKPVDNKKNQKIALKKLNLPSNLKNSDNFKAYFKELVQSCYSAECILLHFACKAEQDSKYEKRQNSIKQLNKQSIQDYLDLLTEKIAEFIEKNQNEKTKIAFKPILDLLSINPVDNQKNKLLQNTSVLQYIINAIQTPEMLIELFDLIAEKKISSAENYISPKDILTILSNTPHKEAMISSILLDEDNHEKILNKIFYNIRKNDIFLDQTRLQELTPIIQYTLFIWLKSESFIHSIKSHKNSNNNKPVHFNISKWLDFTYFNYFNCLDYVGKNCDTSDYLLKIFENYTWSGHNDFHKLTQHVTESTQSLRSIIAITSPLKEQFEVQIHTLVIACIFKNKQLCISTLDSLFDQVNKNASVNSLKNKLSEITSEILISILIKTYLAAPKICDNIKNYFLSPETTTKTRLNKTEFINQVELLRQKDQLESTITILLDNTLQGILCLTIVGALIKFYLTENKQHKAYYGFFERVIHSAEGYELQQLQNQLLQSTQANKL